MYVTEWVEGLPSCKVLNFIPSPAYKSQVQ